MYAQHSNSVLIMSLKQIYTQPPRKHKPFSGRSINQLGLGTLHTLYSVFPYITAGARNPLENIRNIDQAKKGEPNA